jgi:3-methyladenine DNA glycosylase AlkC
MAEPLKNRYTKEFISQLASAVAKDFKKFPREEFVAAVMNREWKAMELKQRMRQIATSLRAFIPGTFPEVVPVIESTIQRLRESGMPDDSFECMFFPDFIEVFGIEHPKESLKAIEFITQFTSCEFAIRPFIVRYPELTMRQMEKWSKHKSEKVRRLSSEGSRPRLPWAMALPEFKKDPSPALPILENLKNDSSLYVRKSVANHLNDIAKDHPSIVLGVVKRWQGQSEETDWILKHGCRTLLRKADPEILKKFGMSADTNCELNHLSIDRNKINHGEKIELNFSIQNKGKRKEKYRVEYGIDFVKSNGTANRKLFKITETDCAPGAELSYTRRHSFHDLTTRKHYSGKHIIAIVVNGKELGRTELLLRM